MKTYKILNNLTSPKKFQFEGQNPIKSRLTKNIRTASLPKF